MQGHRTGRPRSATASAAQTAVWPQPRQSVLPRPWLVGWGGQLRLVRRAPQARGGAVGSPRRGCVARAAVPSSAWCSWPRHAQARGSRTALASALPRDYTTRWRAAAWLRWTAPGRRAAHGTAPACAQGCVSASALSSTRHLGHSTEFGIRIVFPTPGNTFPSKIMGCHTPFSLAFCFLYGLVFAIQNLCSAPNVWGPARRPSTPRPGPRTRS